jgi:hypothetical protein
VLDGKTLLQASELKHAQLLADRLISAVGDREQTPTQIDAADRRQRAFSLFVKAYDEARRAIQYVRWETATPTRSRHPCTRVAATAT